MIGHQVSIIVPAESTSCSPIWLIRAAPRVALHVSAISPGRPEQCLPLDAEQHRCLREWRTFVIFIRTPAESVNLTAFFSTARSGPRRLRELSLVRIRQEVSISFLRRASGPTKTVRRLLESFAVIETAPVAISRSPTRRDIPTHSASTILNWLQRARRWMIPTEREARKNPYVHETRYS